MQTEPTILERPEEIQRWSCYVDHIDEATVTLVMHDETVDRGGEQEIGEFPKHLLAHLEPRLGQYVTVRIMSDEKLVIENTHISDEARAEGKAQIDELLGLLMQLRREDADPASV